MGFGTLRSNPRAEAGSQMHHSLTFTCQAVLFDLDGTLIDSTDRIDRLWRWWADRRGIPFEELTGSIVAPIARDH